MDFVEVSSPDAAVLHLDDESLLAGVSDLRWRLDDVLSGREPILVVDLSRLSLLSSATLAALLWSQRRCRARGGQVVLRRPNRRCRTLLTRTGLAGMFELETEGAKLGQSASTARASS